MKSSAARATTSKVHHLPPVAAPSLKNTLAITNIASRAIDLQVQKDAIDAQMVPLKDELRDYAAGATQTIDVPGKGKVMVSKPTAPVAKKVLIADYDRFMALPTRTQKQILALAGGALELDTKTSSGSAAKVTVSPNV